MQPRFPVTLFPGSPIPDPPVTRWSLLAPDDPDAPLVWRVPPVQITEPNGPNGLAITHLVEPKPLLAEWVLRELADADLSDDDHVSELLRSYGVISWPYFDPAMVPTDDHQVRNLDSAQTVPGWWRGRSDGTLNDARWWLRTARAVTGVWCDVSQGQSPSDAWIAEGFHDPGDDHSAWRQFVTAINAGLDGLRVRAEYSHDDVVSGTQHVGLYTAACVQVHNLIVREETWNVCRNEKCDHKFIYQRDGATPHGTPHKSGVLYCTPECNKAQKQREYRRRERAKNREAS